MLEFTIAACTIVLFIGLCIVAYQANSSGTKAKEAIEQYKPMLQQLTEQSKLQPWTPKLGEWVVGHPYQLSSSTVIGVFIGWSSSSGTYKYALVYRIGHTDSVKLLNEDLAPFTGSVTPDMEEFRLERLS